jgi:hypothetical protein
MMIFSTHVLVLLQYLFQEWQVTNKEYCVLVGVGHLEEAVLLDVPLEHSASQDRQELRCKTCLLQSPHRNMYVMILYSPFLLA